LSGSCADKDLVTKNINKNGKYGEIGDYGNDWSITHDAGSGPYTVSELKQHSTQCGPVQGLLGRMGQRCTGFIQN